MNFTCNRDENGNSNLYVNVISTKLQGQPFDASAESKIIKRPMFCIRATCRGWEVKSLDLTGYDSYYLDNLLYRGMSSLTCT